MHYVPGIDLHDILIAILVKNCRGKRKVIQLHPNEARAVTRGNKTRDNVFVQESIGTIRTSPRRTWDIDLLIAAFDRTLRGNGKTQSAQNIPTSKQRLKTFGGKHQRGKRAAFTDV